MTKNRKKGSVASSPITSNIVGVEYNGTERNSLNLQKQTMGSEASQASEIIANAMAEGATDIRIIQYLDESGRNSLAIGHNKPFRDLTFFSSRYDAHNPTKTDKNPSFFGMGHKTAGRTLCNCEMEHT